MFALQTKKELQPFCYEHLTEMMPYDEAALTYVCPVWNCLVNYASSGYFIAAKGDMPEQSMTPSLRCPNDGMPMYLAEIHWEHKSYQLWRCSQCGKSLTNLESMQASACYRSAAQKRKHMSAAARARIAKAQRARWAKVRAAK